MTPARRPPSVLFVLHQMGTLDHVHALHHQLERAGATVNVALGAEGLTLPDWFTRNLPSLVIIDDPLAAIAERRYDAVVMQMPYDDLKAPVWSAIGRDEAYVVYSGYGVWTLTWDEGGYGLPFHARCSLILAASPWARDKYLLSEQAPLDAVWSGDPLMYELVHAESLTAKEPTILWAPHWSETWIDGSPGFSTWKSTVHLVLAAARRNPSIRFIVRGHPLMKTDVPDRRSRRASRAYRKLVALPNAWLSTESMRHDILKSTALLTDGLSIIPYYCTTGKPLGITRRTGTWNHLDASGKALFSLSDQLHNKKQIQHWLRAACNELVTQSIDRKVLVSRLFPLRTTSPGEHLLDSLG